MSCSANPAETNCLQTTYSSSSNQVSNYTYDAAGNVTNDGTYSYQWDAEGRLAAVTLSGSVVSMNTYNALGQRVEDVTQSSTTEEAYGAGGALLARYTGDTNSRSFVPFNGGLLAEYYCGGVIFDHPDELGSATTATDCTGKNVQERLYYPFGEFWNGAGSLGMHQEFAQLPDYDPETDQYNTANRHYTSMGRWLTPDPSGVKAARLDDPQTWNMYAYTRNNPTTVTDPSGLVTPAVAAMSNEFPDIAAGSPFFSEDPLDMAVMMTLAQNEAEVNNAWHNWTPQETATVDPTPQEEAQSQKETVVFSDNANPQAYQEKPGVTADRTVDYQAAKMDRNGNVDSHDIERNADLTLHEKLDPNSKTKNVIIADKPNTEKGIYKDYQEVPTGGSYRVLRDWKVDGNAARVLDLSTHKAYGYELTTLDANSKTPIKAEYTNVPPF